MDGLMKQLFLMSEQNRSSLFSVCFLKRDFSTDRIIS
jgi:hypothetical protein